MMMIMSDMTPSPHFESIKALSTSALKTHLKDGYIVGLGSGSAASILVKTLSEMITTGVYNNITGIPTSLQIKQVVEECKGTIRLTDADAVDYIDVVFDGADQIDSQGFVIKGGGGALLRENILFHLAKKVIVIADTTKFVDCLTRTVPIEIHPLARTLVNNTIQDILNGKPQLRTINNKGYPFITENGNIILDCDFGTIDCPEVLSHNILQIPGVIECGIFLKRPDVIYRAEQGGTFGVIDRN